MCSCSITWNKPKNANTAGDRQFYFVGLPRFDFNEKEATHKMRNILNALAVAVFSLSLAFAQIPTTYSGNNPSPNASGGNCIISTAPTFNYLTGVSWFCSPNSGPPTNLGTWTSYTPYTGTGNTLVKSVAPAISNPVITGPAPVACGATCTVTAGQLVLLNLAAGSTVTIPTSSGSGNVIRMRVTVATTSAAEKVLLATTADAIIGTAIGENAGTAKIFVGNASTYHSIQMPFAGTQPSGGFIGDAITCTDIAAGTWACDIEYQAGTTPTTPYSASTT